jgi:hypothetical protein
MSKVNINIEFVTHTLLQIEEKYNLLYWKVNEVYIWQSLRASMYGKIVNFLLPNNTRGRKTSFNEKNKTILRRIFINSLLKNPFVDFKKVDILVFDSGRKYFVNDKYIDIYTEYFINELNSNNIKYRRYNISHKTDKVGQKIKTDKHLDFIYLISRIISLFIILNISRRNLSKIILIENEIKNVFNYNFDFRSLIIKEIKRFKSQFLLYNWLIKLKSPKEIYLINSTDKAPLIMAAKRNHVIVNELQHGLIVKEGLIANFPNVKKNSLAYFPDKFYLWKDLNMCTSILPLKEENIIEFPNKHLENMKFCFRNTDKKKNQILVVSQPVHSESLLKYILSNVSKMMNYKIFYKIHPMENASYIESQVLKNNFSEKIRVVRNEESIYKLLAQSEIVLGIYSTSLFEASYFGCKILLLDMPGVEVAHSLIENGQARLIKREDNLLNLLQKYY